MIDSHFHLEQKDYDSDREELVENWKKELKAVITCSARPQDLKPTINFVNRWKGFVFATAAIHPLYVKDFSQEEVNNCIEKIKKNSSKLVGIGETGIDVFHIREEKFQKEQEELFVRFINLSKKLNLPLVIHSRDGHETTLKLLYQENAKNVYWHMFGAKKLLNNVLENGYYIGANAIILKSKTYKKIIRDAPLERILTETDAPWLHPKTLFEGKPVRNDPTTIRTVIKRIADIKKLDFEVVDKVTTENAISFFQLKF